MLLQQATDLFETVFSGLPRGGGGHFFLLNAIKEKTTFVFRQASEYWSWTLGCGQTREEEGLMGGFVIYINNYIK